MKTDHTIKLVLLVLLAVFAAANLAAFDVYHWVDQNGVAHYSQYRPASDIPNVKVQKLEDTRTPGDGQVEDIYNVEAHEKHMAAWRQEREQMRKDARERKMLAAQQQPVRYPQPERNYVRPYWYPPLQNRPIHRPSPKPRPPVANPRPPSRVKPRGGSS